MNPIIASTVVLLLLILRFALPCAVVGGLCYTLDRLMNRWDEEAQRAQETPATQ